MKPLSRREFLSGRSLLNRLRSARRPDTVWVAEELATAEADVGVASGNPVERALVAEIRAYRCLPFCSVCSERCPEPGAIVNRALRYSVMPELCTGCGVCVDVCPAPQKAVLMLESPFSTAT